MGNWDQSGQIYYYVTDANGASQGPYTASQLAGFGLQDDTMIWCEGMAEWTPAIRVPALSGMVLRQRSATAAATQPGIGGVSPAYDRIWSVHDQGRQFGPHTLQEIAALLSTGNISTSAVAWKAGDPQWVSVMDLVPASAVPVQRVYVSAPAPVYHGSSNRVAAGLCGILIGGLGIHKFVLGYTGAGLIMLLFTVLTCGYGGIVMGVIGLIEGIIYLTKDDAQFYREYVARRREWF